MQMVKPGRDHDITALSSIQSFVGAWQMATNTVTSPSKYKRWDRRPTGNKHKA